MQSAVAKTVTALQDCGGYVVLLNCLTKKHTVFYRYPNIIANFAPDMVNSGVECDPSILPTKEPTAIGGEQVTVAS